MNDKFILAANGKLEQIQKYLGFGAKAVAVKKQEGRNDGSVACIIQVPAEHADWQSQRLASGCYGGHIYDTRRECFEMLEIVVNR